jgi:DNA-binding PadR family transcriptional regulator
MHHDHSDHRRSGHCHDARFARGEFGRGEFGERGSRHGHEGHHGRGGRRRVFDHGELRLVVLALISEKPRHGYEIIKAIEERLAGSYSPSPGVIYPLLTMLEELGHATLEASDGKKLYAITPAGTDYLAAHRPAADAALARMSEISASHGGGPAPQLIRAVENLKLALRLRQARGPLSEDEVRAIAEILDAAAIVIERS